MELSLTGEEGEDTIEGVALFKYPGQTLEQSENFWTSVIRNKRKARQVWGILGVILRWEGADPITSAAFYRAVVQTVLLFGFEKWFLSAATEKRIVGFHTFFLQQVTGKRARRRWGGTWRQGRYRERSEGGGDSGCTDIHRQASSDSGTVGGPSAHI